MSANRGPADDVYLAFRSGALAYDCAPCGRCCRGLGLADAAAELAGKPELRRLAAFAAPPSTAGSLVGFFTYAGGCALLDADGLCGPHARGGPAAKPAICRLFPFTRLVDAGGLRALLPHGECPWVAAGRGPSPLSAHPAVLADLGPVLAGGASPERLSPVTALPAGERRALEERLRDALPADASDLDAALEEHAALQREVAGPVLPAPPRELWLDLLRSAGEPPQPAPTLRRLLLAALPALRVLLTPELPLAAIPAALAAFALWLRTLAELGSRELDGRDLLHLFATARPLVRLLALAGEPVPWRRGPVPPVLEQIRRAVGASEEMPLGEMLLMFLRDEREGAVTLLARVGGALPA